MKIVLVITLRPNFNTRKVSKVGGVMSRVEPLLNWKLCSMTEQNWHARNVWSQ